VLSQCGGSNRAGYTVVSSNSKGSIHLDGLFNIISYDVVPKLHNLLMALEFKVSTAIILFLHLHCVFLVSLSWILTIR
jgi:SWI/SNF-related matrix-associated actin-dependent regulator 1 of chromatin subfamily A